MTTTGPAPPPRPSRTTSGTGAHLPHLPPFLLFSLSAAVMLLLTVFASTTTFHSPDVDTAALVMPPAYATFIPNIFPGRSTVMTGEFFFPLARRFPVKPDVLVVKLPIPSHAPHEVRVHRRRRFVATPARRIPIVDTDSN